MTERPVEEIIGWRRLGPYVYLRWSDSNDVGHIRAEVDDLAAWLMARGWPVAGIEWREDGTYDAWCFATDDAVVEESGRTIRDALIAAVRKVAGHD